MFPGSAGQAHPRLRSLFLFGSLATLGALLGCGGSGGDGARSTGTSTPPAPYVRLAALGGDQEVPANASAARGTAQFSVDPTTKVLTGTVTTSGIDGTASHIHEAVKGTAGPVVIPLQNAGGGVWTVPANTVLTDAQYASLQAYNYYVNVHSAAFPGGEIRGQIELMARFATLTAAQEVPGTSSTASAYASVAVNATTGAVYGTVISTGITGTAAHIHEAAAGTAGPIIVPLTSAGDGVWTVPAGSTLTPAQVASWKSGNLYVNVHTPANPGGEIRGQINLDVPVFRSASLSGAQETPANASAGTGTASLSINPVTLELSGAVVASGLAGTASHIHEAPAGTAGPIILPLNAGGAGVWVVPAGRFLTTSQFSSLLGGNLYANVHSATYPGGEIRGQFLATPSSSTSGGGGGGGTGY